MLSEEQHSQQSRVFAGLFELLKLLRKRIHESGVGNTNCLDSTTLKELDAASDYFADSQELIGWSSYLKEIRASIVPACCSLNPIELRRSDLLVQNLISQIFDPTEVEYARKHALAQRWDLVNLLVKRLGAKNYLEIGCCNDECFNAIRVTNKVGVDPLSGGTLRMTSDQFFAENSQNFDLVFIDGLHEAAQVLKDVENALQVLDTNGAIVLHDCNPIIEIRQIVPQCTDIWNGDVWKAYVALRTRENLDLAMGNFDRGCGVLLKRNNSDRLKIDLDWQSLTWEDLVANRQQYLRPMTIDDLLAWL